MARLLPRLAINCLRSVVVTLAEIELKPQILNRLLCYGWSGVNMRTPCATEADVDAWEINVSTLEDLTLSADVAMLVLQFQHSFWQKNWSNHPMTSQS